MDLTGDPLYPEIRQKVPRELIDLLTCQDGAAQLSVELPKTFSPADISIPLSDPQRAWELCGLFFLNRNRLHEAQAIFYTFYDHMLSHQESTGIYVHKGMPLVYISDCHRRLNHPVLAKRHLMLTACEDAVNWKGEIPSGTGSYFRMVWIHGFTHQEVDQYAAEIWRLYQDHPKEAMFPEWILQELDDKWMTEYPSAREANLYLINRRYVRWLLGRLGSGEGKTLERLAHYLLASMPGCRAYMREKSKSTEYDVVCILEGLGLDFRGEFGRYFICECKDWSRRANFTTFAKFCRILDGAKCRFGILFSKHGITGVGKTTYAEREQLKVFQDRGMVVIVFTESDLENVTAGANFITMLREKYEEVRLDIRKKGFPSTRENS